MTIATAPSADVATPSMCEAVVRLGMPQLAYGGLSETWLLKDLGDRHWRLIAEAAGLERPDFRDVDGAPVYPAFCGTSIEAARFDKAVEHDDLLISSELARVSATQCASRHRLSCRGRPIGTVSLSSVFVRRTGAGQNRALARVAPAILSGLPLRREFVPITGLASAVRAGSWQSHFGFVAEAAAVLARDVVTPCPAQDFNGAGFLYFPSFSVFADRAEWRLSAVAGTTAARDVVYHGNIDVGESVVVEICGLRREAADVVYWCRLVSTGGRRLADVFTRKRREACP